MTTPTVRGGVKKLERQFSAFAAGFCVALLLAALSTGRRDIVPVLTVTSLVVLAVLIGVPVIRARR